MPLSKPTPCISLHYRKTRTPRLERVSQASIDSVVRPQNKISQRTVLVIASRFPPVASVGATRVRKFVKYLCEFGWKPVVVTGSASSGVADHRDPRRVTDEDVLSDLPEELPICRLNSTIDHWPEHLSRVCGERLAAVTGRFGIDTKTWKAGLAWRFQRVHDRFAFPDPGIWRLCPTVRLGLKLHRRHRFDAIFSSGMPFSDHLTALALRRVMRIPWLADFRDPWAEYIHWPQWRNGFGRKLTYVAEAAVVRFASCVISVNESMTRRFIARYARQRPDKFVTIENGFDPVDFINCGADRRQESGTHFRLVYAGSLYGARSPEKVLEAFRRFIRRVSGSRKYARFEFIGRPGSHIDKLMNPADGDCVRYIGILPYLAALDALAGADLNIVLLPNLQGSESDTTTKIYECLGSGRPVLASVPLDGAAARVLRRFDGVTLRDPDDVDGMTAAITDWYRRWLSGPLDISRPMTQLAPLTRRVKTQELAACLDAVVNSRQSSGGTMR